MKKNIIISCALLIVLSACVPQVEQFKNPISYGHEQGNGTDNPPTGFSSAWLTGEDSVISYCAVIAPDFGAEPSVVYAEIEKSFDLWKDYILNKDINGRLEKEATSKLTSWPQVLDRAYLIKLPVLRKLNSTCQGDETIKFYFGVEDSEISAAKKNYYDAIAFAVRKSFNADSGIGNGAIWLSKKRSIPTTNRYFPDWALKNRMLGILTHELGHFYGIGHIEGTIMRETLFGIMSDSTSEDKYKTQNEYDLSHIDGSSELISAGLKINSKSYQGYMNFPALDTEMNAAENFEFVVGRKPVGDVTSRFYKNTIYIYDQISESKLEIDLRYRNIVSLERKYIFNIFRSLANRDGSGSLQFMTSLENQQSIQTGQIVNTLGLKVPILLFYNVGYTPMKITYILDGEQKALMVMHDSYFLN